MLPTAAACQGGPTAVAARPPGVRSAANQPAAPPMAVCSPGQRSHPWSMCEPLEQPAEDPEQQSECSDDAAVIASLIQNGAEIDISMGHRYISLGSCAGRCRRRCDHCRGHIICFYHTWLACSDCTFQIHKSCEKRVNRECAAIVALKEPEYRMQICAEAGLSKQKFKCQECSIFILPGEVPGKQGVFYSELNAVRTPNLCDYSGRYYCEICLWGDTCFIPARIVRNWTFTKHQVSRAAQQYLALMFKRPVLDVQQINPLLFNFVGELAQVRELRKELRVMAKGFLKACPKALKAGLLKVFNERRYLIDAPHMYSLRDLVQVHSKALVKFLVKAHARCKSHIRDKCQTCRDKAEVCSICSEGAALFPFDPFVVRCGRCGRSQHADCRALRRDDTSCPRCRGRLEGGSGVTGGVKVLTVLPETADEGDWAADCRKKDRRGQADGRETGRAAGAEPSAGGAVGRVRSLDRHRSAARSIPAGGRNRVAVLRASGSGSSRGGATVSPRTAPTPPPAPSNPSSEAWLRAIARDREKDSPADRLRHWYSRP